LSDVELISLILVALQHEPVVTWQR